MRSISDVLHNAGGHLEYTCKNQKVLKIRFLDLKSMSMYENKLQSRAIKLLSDQRNVLPNDIWSSMFSELMANIAAGQYAFGSEIATKSLQTITGIADLVSIMCDITPEEAIDIIMVEQDSFKQVFDHVVRSSISSPDDAEVTQKKS